MKLAFAVILICATVSGAVEKDTVDCLVVTAKKLPAVTPALQSVESRLMEDPAVTFIRRGASAPEPVIRGASGNDILVTLDGARVQTACTDHMDPLTSYIANDDLDSVSVDAGSSSLVNGGTSLGKVNLALKRSKPGQEQFKWNVNSQVSSIDSGFSGGGSITWKSPRFAIDVSASAKRIGDYSEPGKEVVAYSGLRAANLLATPTIQLDSATKLTGTFLYDRFWNAGYPALPMDVGFSELVNGAAGIEHVWQNGNSFNALLYGNCTSHAMDDTHRTNISMHMDMPGQGTTLGGWASLHTNVNQHSFDFRLESWVGTQNASMTMYDADNNPSMYMETWPLTSTIGVTGSVADEVRLTDVVYVNGGLTFENRLISVLSDLGKRQVDMLQPDAPTDRNLLSPGCVAGIRFEPSVNNEIGILFSASKRLPAMDELYGFYLFNASMNRDYLGNAKLESENVYKTEISGKYRFGILKVGGTLWGTIKDNVIQAIDATEYTPMTSGAYGICQWENEGREWQAGIESNIMIKPLPVLEFTSIARYMYGKAFHDSHVPQVPTTGGTVSAQYRFRYVNIRPELEWAPAQDRPDPLLGVAKTAGYAVTNLRLSGRVHSGITILWHAGVENVFNQKWRSNLDWDDFTTKKPLYRPGRSFYLGLTFSG
jgi:iron complex outermembrane receptor protein